MCRLCAEGGTRTRTPVKAHAPETCVSTNFTTSAILIVPTTVPVCRQANQFKQKTLCPGLDSNQHTLSGATTSR